MNFELNVELGETTQYSFGLCSLFDIFVELGDDSPFDVPVQRYLEEMLIGIRGNEQHDENATDKRRENWKRLKRVLRTDAMRDVCLELFWIMMGIVLKRVDEDAVQELRESLAKAWALVVLRVRKVAFEGERGTESETQEWLLRYLPVVITQCLYRLLVDGFHEDRSQLTHLSDALLEKITRVVTYEVSGFKLNSSTWHKERKYIFRKTVIQRPDLNQHDALKSQMRREHLEHRSKEPLALTFGQQDSLPLEEEQLEHVMMMRAMAKQKVKDGAGAGAGAAAGAGAGAASAAVAEDLVPIELSVDRYASISQAGDELFERQMNDLNPQLMAAVAEANRRPSHERVTNAGFHLGSEALRQSICTAASSGNYVHKIRNKKEQEQAKKRDREYALQKLILQDPLPQALCERTLDTAWVSPVLDRLVPVQRERQGLQKRAADSKILKMDLPNIMKSQSEPSLRKSGLKLPHLSAQLHTSDGIENAASALASEKKTIKHKTDILLQPPASLKNAVVIDRLNDHLAHFNKHAFSNYSKEYDIGTGVKKQRMDPAAMRRAENNYVASLHALVGPAKQPGLKMYNSPERMAKRRALKK
jgi:hypothetical protein